MFSKVLLQEEDPIILRFLQRKGIDTTVAKNSQTACKALQEISFDLIFCSDFSVLHAAKTSLPQALIILLATEIEASRSIEALHHGAFDVLISPLTFTMVEKVFERAEEAAAVKKAISFQCRGKMEQLITDSPLMKKILDDILKVARSSASVFISGESGTGKEVVAQAIHSQSSRLCHPFIKVNCAAIPESLLESEFFGHEKGAFTGAIEKRLGRFELAHKGTLLLDEISEIPLSLQAKLLRAIQEQEFERVGGSKSIQVDVRFISTSNRNMKETVENKLFREDLYYRLNVIPIQLPPLRARKEDIIPLADFFLQRLSLENRKSVAHLSFQAKKHLLDYHWPGNIRELANVIERTIVMNLGQIIEPEHLRLEIACPIPPLSLCKQSLTLKEIEKKSILEALSFHQQNKTQTARTLGISLRTLRNKLSEYNQKKV